MHFLTPQLFAKRSSMAGNVGGRIAASAGSIALATAVFIAVALVLALSVSLALNG